MKLPEGGHDWNSITKRPEEFKICDTCGFKIRLIWITGNGNEPKDGWIQYGKQYTSATYANRRFIPTCSEFMMEKTLG